MKKLFTLTFLFLALLAQGAVIELEPLGESYPIAEVDIVAFIEQRARTTDFGALVRERFDKAFRKATTGRLSLPVAEKDDTRRVTPQATLTQGDIFTVDKTGKKQVIYPNGFRFNPLDYTKVPDYYIINANREKEAEWLLGQEIPASALVILSEGYVLDFIERLDRPVYLLSEVVQKALYVEKTPSIVKQEGNALVIREYKL